MTFQHRDASAMNSHQATLQKLPYPIPFDEFSRLDEQVKYNICKTLEAREKSFQIQMKQKDQQLIDYKREIEQAEYEKQQLKQSLKQHQHLIETYQKANVSNRNR